MYNAWWIAIGFGILMVIFAVIIVILKTKKYKAYEKYAIAEKIYLEMAWGSPEKKKAREEYNNLHEKFANIQCPFWIKTLMWIFFAGTLATAFITSMLIIDTKQVYNEFIETQIMVEEVYNADFNQYENLGLNNKIIEMNEWLVNAKASKKQWGNWSYYCVVDVENLDYITLLDAQNGE